MQVSDGLQSTHAKTKENTTALVDYSKRVWKISNWWRSPPQTVRSSSKPKLLIVYSDTGGGHKASATAICAAFEHLVPGQIEVKLVDVIEQYSLWPANRTYKFFTDYPWLWGTIYKTTKHTHARSAPIETDSHGAQSRDSIPTTHSPPSKSPETPASKARAISRELANASTRYTETPKSTLVEHLLDPASSLEPFLLEGFIRCIQEERPDMIMSVHPILQSSERATSSHLKDGRQIPFVTVVTDLGEAHPWWFNKRVNRLFVPTHEMKHQGVQVGIKQEHIHVTGLPLRQAFWFVDVSRERQVSLRQSLGLDPRRPLVLLMGGGDGMGKLNECALSFLDLLAAPTLPPAGLDMQVYLSLESKPPACGQARVHCLYVPRHDAHLLCKCEQVVIICGNNSGLQQKLSKAAASASAGSQRELSIRVLGFVSNVDEWMAAADVLVTKAGPGTIAEACCCALPILLFDYLPGQEERNVTFVCDKGIGEWEADASKAALRCYAWLQDPQKLARFRQVPLRQSCPDLTCEELRVGG